MSYSASNTSSYENLLDKHEKKKKRHREELKSNENYPSQPLSKKNTGHPSNKDKDPSRKDKKRKEKSHSKHDKEPSFSKQIDPSSSSSSSSEGEWVEQPTVPYPFSKPKNTSATPLPQRDSWMVEGFVPDPPSPTKLISTRKSQVNKITRTLLVDGDEVPIDDSPPSSKSLPRLIPCSLCEKKRFMAMGQFMYLTLLPYQSVVAAQLIPFDHIRSMLEADKGYWQELRHFMSSLTTLYHPTRLLYIECVHPSTKHTSIQVIPILNANVADELPMLLRQGLEACSNAIDPDVSSSFMLTTTRTFDLPSKPLSKVYFHAWLDTYEGWVSPHAFPLKSIQRMVASWFDVLEPYQHVYASKREQDTLWKQWKSKLGQVEWITWEEAK